MSEIIFGQLGTDEENAAYQRWRQESLRADAAVRDQSGDRPEPLTKSDEKILDRAWREVAQENAANPLA